ncbi:HD domain-containing protein [Chryseobacterium sp. JUb7]|uniref:HD domain-containing protein n=1 Tax=Chryseobacterium sp. JUb7 TaxID=2940599 RepID=UPI002168C37D|nr:HD domain-containing protein [Chryseobacterium sp. JUb7]MCS3531254.1 putative metal-dependent HD superfamily phosphohydrolase [Chryseobacterium sp. JUb7]
MNNLIEAVSNYVILFLLENLSDQLTFHNISHTYDAVGAVREIGFQIHLSDKEMYTVQIAAWFHDCGYVNTYIGHEEESKKIAKNFLENFGCEKYFIEAVLRCIESTKYPQHPTCLTDQVMCDADMFHLTKTNYSKYEKALRLEFEKYLGLIFTDEEWKMENRDFFRNHQYFTEYGQNVLAKFKEVNVRLMNYSNKF